MVRDEGSVRQESMSRRCLYDAKNDRCAAAGPELTRTRSLVVGVSVPNGRADSLVARARQPEGGRNLSHVLQLVHRSAGMTHTGVTRADLTRATGLNRSTIGALVGELERLGLVVESAPDSTGSPGRPSPVVRPDPRLVVIAVNPELDAVTAAVVRMGGAVGSRARRSTEGRVDPDAIVETTADLVRQLIDGLSPDERVAGIGAAVPGLVRTSDGVVRLAPHLDWRDERFSSRLAHRTGLAVLADNDASLGCRAEYTFGAGSGARDVVYVNGGASGIGGGIIVSGKPVRGVEGYAGEIGHTLVTRGGAPCHCGARGCLETEVRRDRLLAVLGLTEADDDELEAALLVDSSEEVRAEIHRQLSVLGLALGSVINLLNPARVVLGGFVAALHAAAPEVLDGSLSNTTLAASRAGVSIVAAALGANRLLIGAAELVFDEVLADPARALSSTGETAADASA